ncbi:hypothetical protein HWV62_34999 [Athelia sp. TMB]|nr:hypothetical protein HWV62_34999 [Athelia sp. TMB]
MSLDNLFQYIDRPNVVALNATGEGLKVIKPWHERLDEAVLNDPIKSIIRIPFTGSVKLRSLLLKTGPAELTPAKVVLFSNADNLDFDDATEKTPTQEFHVAQGREIGEYAVKVSKFSNLSSLTLFFPQSQGGDSTQIYYIGLLGQWSERKDNPIITVYETQANLADHEKIQGMDGTFSTPQS